MANARAAKRAEVAEMARTGKTAEQLVQEKAAKRGVSVAVYREIARLEALRKKGQLPDPAYKTLITPLLKKKTKLEKSRK